MFDTKFAVNNKLQDRL